MKLTNNDINNNYRDIEIYCFPSDFTAVLAYCITKQNTNEEIIEIKPALIAFEKHVLSFFDNPNIPQKFTYNDLKEIVNENVFENIPEILALNNLKPSFIDLYALARNVFYMIIRIYIVEHIINKLGE